MSDCKLGAYGVPMPAQEGLAGEAERLRLRESDWDDCSKYRYLSEEDSTKGI